MASSLESSKEETTVAKTKAIENKMEFISTKSDNQIPKYDGTDFGVWKARVEAHLCYKEVSSVLYSKKPRHIHKGTSEEIRKREQEIAEFEHLDRYVKSLLINSLDNKHAKLILSCASAFEIWERLTAIHEQRSSANKIVLQKAFFDLKLERDEKVNDYIARAEYIYSQMKDVGVMIDEQTLIGKIVPGLPRRFMTFMSNWSATDPAQQNLVVLIAKLSAEEQLINQFNRPVENALYGEAKKGKRTYSNKRFTKKDDDKKVEPKKDDRKDNRPPRQCYNCQQFGHIAKQCKNPKVERKYVQKPKEANSIEETAIVVEEADVTVSHSSWIVDTGASSHMTYNKDDLVNFNPLPEKRCVLFGDTNKGFGIGIGDAKLNVFVDGVQKLLLVKGVLLVPELRRKLISVSAATDSGCTGEIYKDKIVLKKEGKSILEALKIGSLYEVRSAQQGFAYVSTESNRVEDPIDLWHERYGHINKVTLAKTSSVVEGMDGVKPRHTSERTIRNQIECDSCKLGKQSKHHIPLRTTKRAESPGEVVHVDICGPVGAPTLAKCEYLILFKDEHTNFRFIHFLKTREEAFDAVRKVVARVKADTTFPVRCIMSDCGSEFTSKRMQEFMKTEKIVHRTSAPFTPAQNGFIERENRTLMEGVRSMLFHRKLSESLWGEAANCFIYLINRAANKSNGDVTSYEMYFKRMPKVRHFKVFESLAFVKTQTKKRSGYQLKIERRAQEGIFVGYDANNDFSYRIFVPNTNKIIISRDVVFDETRTLGGNSDYRKLDGLIDSLEDDNVDDHYINEEEQETQEAINVEVGIEPISFKEAIRSPESANWKAGEFFSIATPPDCH